MSEAATIDNAVVTLGLEVRKLKEENERLRARETERWQLSCRVQKAEDEARDAKRRMEKAEQEYMTAHRDRVHWRNAVRYEQSLKRHTANPRHLPLALPTYNSVRRSRYVATGPFAGVPNCERVFLKHWRKENKRVRGLNGGCGLLELLLSEDINGGPRQLTQRDATVAATVIQWLGTNCGQSFMIECEREIERLRAAGRAKHVG